MGTAWNVSVVFPSFVWVILLKLYLTTVPRVLTRCYQWAVRSFVDESFTKSTIVYCQQADWPTTAIFLNLLMHIYKHRPSDHFHPNRSWPPFFSRSKIRTEYIGQFERVLSRTRWQIGQTLLWPTHRKSHVAFCLPYLHLTLTHSKGRGQGHAHFDC